MKYNDFLAELRRNPEYVKAEKRLRLRVSIEHALIRARLWLQKVLRNGGNDETV